MYKIIFYGISNRVLRIRAQSYLSDICEIVGISDSFYTEDSIQGMKFIPYWEIANIEYDYVLLLTTNGRHHNEIEDLLYKHGVPKEKIIRPRLLWLSGYEYIPDLKDELLKTSGNGIANYCFGLSYSLRGIDFKQLKVPFIDCSWHGADLYYMNKCVQINAKKQLGGGTAMFVMPYYWFNYDMSMSEYQFESGQVFAFRGFQDFHNAVKMDSLLINDYLVSFELFGEKLWKNIVWKKEIPINRSYINLEMKQCLSNIWKKRYSNTIEENLCIFSDMLKLFKRRILIVPPIAKECIDENDLQFFNSMKNSFYSCMESFTNVELYDFSENIKDMNCFYDYEHLNELGRQEFSRIVNNILE